MVVGLDHRDVTLSVHDLLQELKTHPKVRPLLEGGERVEWGAKTIPEGGFLSLPISIAHGVAAGQLERHHEDPFDRMLIAQAYAEGLTIVTRDKRFSEYGIALLPA